MRPICGEWNPPFRSYDDDKVTSGHNFAKKIVIISSILVLHMTLTSVWWPTRTIFKFLKMSATEEIMAII